MTADEDKGAAPPSAPETETAGDRQERGSSDAAATSPAASAAQEPQPDGQSAASPDHLAQAAAERAVMRGIEGAAAAVLHAQIFAERTVAGAAGHHPEADQDERDEQPAAD